HRTVEAFGPEMRSGDSVDQLGGDAYPSASLAHRTFEHIADTQFAADLLHIDRLALVCKTGIAGDYEEPADARQRGNDLLDHAIGEMFVLGVAAHIGEGQYRDRRFGGGGRFPLTRLSPLALGTLSRNAGEGGPRRNRGGGG